MKDINKLLHKVDVIVKQTKTNLENLNSLLNAEGFGSINFSKVLTNLERVLEPLKVFKMMDSGKYETLSDDQASLVVEVENDNSIKYYFVDFIDMTSVKYSCYADIEFKAYKNLARKYIQEHRVSLGVDQDYLVKEEILTVEISQKAPVESIPLTIEAKRTEDPVEIVPTANWKNDPISDLAMLNKLTTGQISTK